MIIIVSLVNILSTFYSTYKPGPFPFKTILFFASDK